MYLDDRLPRYMYEERVQLAAQERLAMPGLRATREARRSAVMALVRNLVDGLLHRPLRAVGACEG
jgi:hypothetical protein